MAKFNFFEFWWFYKLIFLKSWRLFWKFNISWHLLIFLLIFPPQFRRMSPQIRRIADQILFIATLVVVQPFHFDAIRLRSIRSRSTGVRVIWSEEFLHMISKKNLIFMSFKSKNSKKINNTENSTMFHQMNESIANKAGPLENQSESTSKTGKDIVRTGV